MKSHTAKPEDFASCAKNAEDFGADLVYLVDSAGGMLPNEIAPISIRLRKNRKI